MTNPLTFLKEVRKELKQVTWPTRQETTRFTMIVIGFSLATAVFLGLADFGFSKAVSALLDINL